MAAKAISLLEPKRHAEVNKTNDPRYCPYHRIISHPIKDYYVFKDIIEDMIRRGEIEIEGAPPKGSTASSNTTSMIEQKHDSYLSLLETNEGIPTVSLPPHAVSIKFMVDDDVAVVWAYPDIPQPSPGAPTLYIFYLDPSLEAWATSEDDDDDGFGWQTYVSRKSFRQGMTQSTGVKIRGQKPPQKKSKKTQEKEEKVGGQKEAGDHL